MNSELVVPIKSGKLVAKISPDPSYPGIVIEYLNNEEDELSLSRPSVVIEQSKEDNPKENIYCYIWNNSQQEDYTEKHLLWEK